jgi:hypothetical protein
MRRPTYPARVDHLSRVSTIQRDRLVGLAQVLVALVGVDFLGVSTVQTAAVAAPPRVSTIEREPPGRSPPGVSTRRRDSPPACRPLNESVPTTRTRACRPLGAAARDRLMTARPACRPFSEKISALFSGVSTVRRGSPRRVDPSRRLCRPWGETARATCLFAAGRVDLSARPQAPAAPRVSAAQRDRNTPPAARSRACRLFA